MRPKLTPVQQDNLKSLRSIFRPGQFLINERENSCFGKKLPLFLVVLIKKSVCCFRASEHLGLPGFYVVDLQLEILTTAHSFVGRFGDKFPIIQFRREFGEDVPQTEVFNLFDLFAGVILIPGDAPQQHRGSLGTFSALDGIVDDQKNKFEFRFARADEVEDLKNRQKRLAKIFAQPRRKKRVVKG